MDDKRIAEIRARVEAATPGPWEMQTRQTNWNTLGLETFVGRPIADNLSLEHQVVTSWEHGQVKDKVVIFGISVSPYREHTHMIHVRPEDADFVAHSRQDIPDLLAALDAARADVARLRKQLEDVDMTLLVERDNLYCDLLGLRQACLNKGGTTCRLCQGTWIAYEGEKVSDHHDGCPMRQTVSWYAALAATEAQP